LSHTSNDRTRGDLALLADVGAPRYIWGMAPDVSEFLETAKLLSRDDIADLAYQLLQVLDGEASADAATVESAWRADFRRRIDEIESGEVELVDGRQTLTMARAMRSARRA